MALIEEYMKKSPNELRNSLRDLIRRYNEYTDSYLFIYSAAIGKQVPGLGLDPSDYYVIHDLLRGKKDLNAIDFYIETPGGSGETAEEIVRFLRENFEQVRFLVCGKAMSAGTIMVMAGDEILMTDSGSLGPIDAQVRIGRSFVSAYDYMEYIDEKKAEADKTGVLNPVDATMIAQISPGELGSAHHSLEFAKDLVTEWLYKYKFKNWDRTETKGTEVTSEMKKAQASEIARHLTDRKQWRTHARAIKINDLEKIGLRVQRVDDDADLSDLVYRIHTVCRMIFDLTSAYKMFATVDDTIYKNATKPGGPANIEIKKTPEGLKLPADIVKAINKGNLTGVAEIEHTCEKCGKLHKVYGKFDDDPQVDIDFKKKGYIPFPSNGRLLCDCGAEIDLTGIKNEIESKIGKKLIIPKG